MGKSNKNLGEDTINTYNTFNVNNNTPLENDVIFFSDNDKNLFSLGYNPSKNNNEEEEDLEEFGCKKPSINMEKYIFGNIHDKNDL